MRDPEPQKDQPPSLNQREPVHSDEEPAQTLIS